MQQSVRTMSIEVGAETRAIATRPEIGRRAFLAAGAGFAALALAGCATTPSQLSTSRPGTVTPAAARDAVPAEVRAYYAAVEGDQYPIRASRIELVPQPFWRQTVANETGEQPGSVVVDTTTRHLYYVNADGTATRYGVGIGAAGFEWSGRAHIAYKREWPRWTPPSDMIKRQPELEPYRYGMEPGPANPLGPRALYIHQGNRDTLYRIHGNEDERTIGKAVSSGCVRLLPQDIIDLYDRVRPGATLLVV